MEDTSRKFLVAIVIVALVSTAAIGGIFWKQRQGEPRFTLTTNVEPSNGGTISLNPSGGTYKAGTEVTLTATSALGYNFSHWSGDVSTSIFVSTAANNPVTVTINSDKTVTAHFSLIEDYTLTVDSNPSEGGTVQLDPSGGTYSEDTSVTLMATPNENYTFDRWSGDATGTNTSVDVIMDTDKTVTAHFCRPPSSLYYPSGITAIVLSHENHPFTDEMKDELDNVMNGAIDKIKNLTGVQLPQYDTYVYESDVEISDNLYDDTFPAAAAKAALSYREENGLKDQELLLFFSTHGKTSVHGGYKPIVSPRCNRYVIYMGGYEQYATWNKDTIAHEVGHIFVKYPKESEYCQSFGNGCCTSDCFMSDPSSNHICDWCKAMWGGMPVEEAANTTKTFQGTEFSMSDAVWGPKIYKAWPVGFENAGYWKNCKHHGGAPYIDKGNAYRLFYTIKGNPFLYDVKVQSEGETHKAHMDNSVIARGGMIMWGTALQYRSDIPKTHGGATVVMLDKTTGEKHTAKITFG